VLFNDRRANKRALKAAQGSSLASKGYESDTEGRMLVRRAALSGATRKESRKQRYAQAASDVTLSKSNYINGKYGPYNAPKGKK
jgi:hypothetical protein